jgi:hypothetical protein
MATTFRVDTGRDDLQPHEVKRTDARVLFHIAIHDKDIGKELERAIKEARISDKDSRNVLTSVETSLNNLTDLLREKRAPFLETLQGYDSASFIDVLNDAGIDYERYLRGRESPKTA